ncbi:MAG: DNA-3-methyladenine glycosylase I [Microbacteriaceae bacterium]
MTEDSARSTETPSTIVGEDGLARCAWAGTDPEYVRYHDEEWGHALHGDQALFEKLSLEAFQAGLSWITILRKRPAFRAAFHGFTIEAVATMTDAELDALLHEPAIVRSRAKIQATRANARLTRELVSSAPGAFDKLMWNFAPATRKARPRTLVDVPAITAQSTALSSHLKKLGYSFVGPTTMYALMQSSGMVDDHVSACWRAE